MNELNGFKDRMKGNVIIAFLIVAVLALISLFNYIINLLN